MNIFFTLDLFFVLFLFFMRKFWKDQGLLGIVTSSYSSILSDYTETHQSSEGIWPHLCPGPVHLFHKCVFNKFVYGLQNLKK